ncbi:hypothetical protein [Nocardioides sp.]|uniref:hypothetical protein n=1 Tax=Nocardioides sp. TaxID=35761 RepID=UPI003562560F
MRPSGDDAPWQWEEIICPQCFTELFAEKFPKTTWQLAVDHESLGGKAFGNSQVRSLVDTLAADLRAAKPEHFSIGLVLGRLKSLQDALGGDA